MLGVARAAREHLVGDLGDELGVASLGDPRHRADALVAVAALQLVEQALALRVAVHAGDRAHGAVGLDQVDTAPVGERGHGELDDVGQRRLEVKRGRQQ